MKDKAKNDMYPSLFTQFKPGERVSRTVRNNDGKIKEYEGIIMALSDEKMEVYWDTLDGEYSPFRIKDDFTMCPVDEVLNGRGKCSPIKRKKRSYIDW